MNYKIELILSEENVKVLLDAIANYKGKNKLIANTLGCLIKRQVEIQKGK